MKPARILFEDNHLIAVNKRAGELVIPSDRPEPDDEVLLKRVRDHLGARVDAPHRLDRPTSGVVLFAKSKLASRRLNQAFAQGAVEKRYWALVEGECPGEWLCDKPLRKTEAAPLKPALTHFRRLDCLGGDSPFCWLEAKPETGRFHQIRRHLAAVGHPIIGDYRYADIARSDAWGRKLGSGTRMWLHAVGLEFDHPQTGERIHLEAGDELFGRLADRFGD